jgi:hypothetical protein
MCEILVRLLAYMMLWEPWSRADVVHLRVVRRGRSGADVCATISQDGEMLEETIQC